MDADEETRINYLFLVVSLQCCLFWLLLGRKFAQATKKPLSFVMTARVSFPPVFPTRWSTNRNTRHCNDIRPSLKRRYLRVRRAVWKSDVDLTKMKRMTRFEQFSYFPPYFWQMHFFLNRGRKKEHMIHVHAMIHISFRKVNAFGWNLAVIHVKVPLVAGSQDQRLEVWESQLQNQLLFFYMFLLCVCQILKNLLKII